MQLNSKNIQNKICVGILGFFWVVGLLVAGSDGPYMPWLNLAGTLVFLGASLWLGKILPGGQPSRPEETETGAALLPAPVKAIQKASPRVNIGYAGGWSTV